MQTTCKQCPYYYNDEGGSFIHCHFPDEVYPAPCEEYHHDEDREADERYVAELSTEMFNELKDED